MSYFNRYLLGGYVAPPVTPTGGDFSVNTYTGNGGTKVLEGNIDEVGCFNGTTSYIDAGFQIPATTGGLAYSFWFKTSTTGATQFLIADHNAAGTDATARLAVGIGNTNFFSFTIGDGSTGWVDSTSISSISYQDGNWHHMVLTASGTTVNVYLDGGTATTFTSTVAIGTAGANNVHFGRLGLSNNFYLNGCMDQVRVFNRAVTAAEATTLYGETSASTTKNTTDIFSDGSAIDLFTLNKDGNGNGYPGAFTGQSADFDGATTDINIGAISELLTQNFSISAWINMSALTDNQAIISNYVPSGGTSRGWFIRYRNSTGLEFSFRGSTADVSLNNNFQPQIGRWVHFCVTVSATAKTLYINGVEVASLGAENIVYLGSQSTYFGRLGSLAAQYFNGRLDQVRIFNTDISAAQVQQLFLEPSNNSTEGTLNFPAGAGAIALYQLDGTPNDTGGTYNGTWTGTAAYGDPAIWNGYSGTATDVTFEGTGFEPGLLWIKNRDSADNHRLVDSVRGANNYLVSNLTNAETNSATNVTSLDSNGYTLGSANSVNRNNDGFAAWIWKAGGAPTTDNVAGAGAVPTAGSVKIDGADSTATLAGSIPATRLSANTALGFSIVEYTGNGTAGATIGHGLSSAPEMIIFKNLDVVTNWSVYGSGSASDNLGETNVGHLNLNNAFSATGDWNNTAPTSTVFTVGTSNRVNTTDDFIAYCFHSVSGVSSIGSYAGTNTSQSITGLGFKPRFLLIKNTSATNNWIILDSTRNPSNPKNLVLEPNTSDAESTETVNVNFVSDGFELTTGNSDVNDGSGTYIYLAYA